MSRGVFNSHNKVGEVLFFNTTSNSGTTFDPNVEFVSGTDRVSWDFGLGGGYVAGNNQSITYPDNGTVKNCQLRTNRLSNLSVLNFPQDNIYGDLDLTKFYNLYYISFNSSSQLSAVTHSYSPTPITSYDLSSCNITGHHDISMLDVGGDFQMANNSSLTGVTHSFNALSTSFDGVDDYVDIGTLLNFLGNKSVSMWLKFTDSGGYRVALNVGSDAYGMYSTAGKIAFYHKNTANAYKDVVASTTTNDGLWHHYLGVNDGTNLKIYIDGVLDNSNTNGSNGTTLNANGRIGARWNNSNVFSGSIDEVAIFDTDQSANASAIGSTIPTDLTPYSPLGWWRMGDGDTYPTITDNGSGGNDGTMTNMSVNNFSTDTPMFNALSTSFDGVDDYVNISDNSNLSFGNGTTDSPFSISGWIKMDDISGFRLLNKYVGSTFEYSFGTGGAGNLQLYLLSSASKYRARLQSTFLNTGQWYHIASTYDGRGGSNAQDGIKIYVDGVRVDDTSVSVGSYVAMANTTVPVHIGKLNTSYTDGNIDEVAIFNSELSQSDITSIYNGGTPNDISSLSPISWWRCGDNDTYPKLIDNGTGGNDGTMTNMSSANFVTDTPIGPGQSFTRYTLNDCDLTGNHVLSMYPSLAGDFRIHTNPNLTRLFHANTDPSASNFTRYWAFNCDLTGEHDMSPLTNIGGQVYLNSNTSLTGITHSPTTGTITRYWVYNCDLTGNHDLSMFTELGGSFQFFSNSNLTSVTHTANTDPSWTLYTGSNCDLTGNHDMTWCPNLGGNFTLSSNLNLTGITHTASNKLFTFYQLQGCDIKPQHDVSMLTGLGGFFSMGDNFNLSGITNPVSNQTFTFYSLSDCNFTSGIDFYPLSGANFSDGEIRLEDNNMSASIVNTMLQDFSGITSSNVTSWSGVTLNISGSNSAPDTTSGGINGIAALSYLTGVTPQWSITTT